MWTLAPLVDPKTKLELLPDASIEGERHHQVGMNVFFDAASNDLLKIEWKGE